MSAAWLPRGFGRLGFIALALASLLLGWRYFDGRPPVKVIALDPVIGQTLALNLTAAMPGRIERQDARPRPGGLHLVNLFASWCIPCRAETPILAALTAHGIRIEGIAVSDQPAAVEHFLAATGNPFASVRLDPAGRVQAALGAAGLPETYVVDARGVILYRRRGALRDEDAASIAERVHQAALLAVQPSRSGCQAR